MTIYHQSGHLPILVTYKKPEKKWSEEDIETVNKEITDIFVISKTKEKISIICDNKNEDCNFCQHMKIRIKDNLSTRLKSIRSDSGNLKTTGYGGCEEDNVFIHLLSKTLYDYHNYEMFSRARKKLMLMMSENTLNKYRTLCGVVKELRNHEQNCENKACQENGWSKKKVIEVHEVAALKDYEYTDSDKYNSDPDSSLNDSDSEI